MTIFDDREKALENRYFRNEEVRFRVVAKRRKFLGMWAAERMHKSEEDSLRYALEVVQSGVAEASDDRVVKKILRDMQDAGLKITERELRDKMTELEDKAKRQVEKEYGEGN